MAEKQFYKIKAQAGSDTAEIFIYEEIGENWWTGEGIGAKNFVRELNALTVRNINVRINCMGGSVFDGQAIHNALKRHPAQVTTYNDGWACSIASVIFLAGDVRVMAPNGVYMIHLPTTDCFNGNAEEMRRVADLLDTVRDTIVTVYKQACTLSEEEIIAAMNAETYYTANEALALGFATEVGVDMKLAACARKIDVKALGYRNAPKVTAGTATPGCHDNPAMYAQMPCELCDMSADCSNPNCSMTESEEAKALGNTKPQGAKKEEVVIMAEPVVAPDNGAKRDFSAEAAEIVTMCGQYGVSADKTREFIQAKKAPGDVGLAILDLIATGQSKVIVPAAEAPSVVDMGRKGKDYSYAKAIAAGLSLRENGKASGFEYEIHQEIAKKLPQNYEARGGIMVPMRVNNTTLTTGGTNTGKETVFQEYGEFIDLLRNMMCSTRMGAKLLTGLQGPVTFPKLTGASTAYWVGENPGSGVTQGNVTFGTMTISPKTLMSTGALSRQLIVQSSPDVEGIVRDDMAQIHGLEWDRVAMHGTGSNNQPTGIYAAAGVNAKAMGGAPTFGKLVDMATAVAKKNALLGNLGFCTTPEMAGLLMQTLKNSVAGSAYIWEGNHIEGMVAGFKAMATNQCAANLGGGNDEHCMIFGNWADLLIGMWGALEITVDPYTLADQGLLKLVSYQLVDIGLRRAESFTKATGAKLS